MTYIACVTGASSGIGEATARRLAREPNINLVLVARREERLTALADELGGPGRARVVACDLTEEGSPARVREFVERQHGALHLLVNNAGAAWRGSFADTGWANVERLRQHGGPFVLVGDLNAPPGAPEIGNLMAAELFRMCGDDIACTHRYMRQRIDYVFADPGWTTESYQVIRSGPSDHWPVLVELHRPSQD